LHRDQFSSDNLHLYFRKLEQEMTAFSRGRRPYNISVLQWTQFAKAVCTPCPWTHCIGDIERQHYRTGGAHSLRARRQSAPVVQTAGLKISQELGYPTKAGVAGRIERAGPRVQPLPAVQMRRATVAR
jgi:hypothetical protein